MITPEPSVNIAAVRPDDSRSRRRGCLPTLTALLLLCLILVTGMIGFGVLGVLGIVGERIGSTGDEAQFNEVSLVRHKDVEDKIAVVDIKGMIAFDLPYDGCDANMAVAQLDQAASDPHVVAVVLDMNTPGGEITAADEVHQAVLRLRRADKPVVVCMRALGASGGYYIAAGANHIIANRLTLTGSIGVIYPQVRYEQLLDKIGVAYTPYASGTMKTALSGAVDRDEQEQVRVDKYLQDMVEESFHRFAAVVADGRSMFDDADAVIHAPFGDGRVLSGDRALDLGLVDEIGYFRDALARAAKLAGGDKFNVVRYRRASGLSQLLMSRVAAKPEIRLETGLIPARVRPGRLYYLMPSVVE